MNRYEQSTGRWYDADGSLLGVGYSGRYPDGKNKPLMQSVKDVGPVPTGRYRIDAPVNTVTHGPYVLRIVPDPKNVMYGRTGFLCHGDSVINPGSASEGCIVLSRDVREAIWNSNDHTLQVVSGLPVEPTDVQIESGS